MMRVLFQPLLTKVSLTVCRESLGINTRIPRNARRSDHVEPPDELFAMLVLLTVQLEATDDATPIAAQPFAQPQ